MTKQRFAFYYLMQRIQYKYMGKDDKWHCVAKTNIQRVRSDRPLTLSAHINSVRIQRESATTGKVKEAAHTLLCMPFKLVFTLDYLRTSTLYTAGKEIAPNFFSVHSYMTISC